MWGMVNSEKTAPYLELSCVLWGDVQFCYANPCTA